MAAPSRRQDADECLRHTVLHSNFRADLLRHVGFGLPGSYVMAEAPHPLRPRRAAAAARGSSRLAAAAPPASGHCQLLEEPSDLADELDFDFGADFAQLEGELDLELEALGDSAVTDVFDDLDTEPDDHEAISDTSSDDYDMFVGLVAAPVSAAAAAAASTPAASALSRKRPSVDEPAPLKAPKRPRLHAAAQEPAWLACA